MKRPGLLLVSMIGGIALPALAAPPGTVDGLIPRKLLFGNPDRAMPQISPDGRWLAWLAPNNGVMNVWVAPADKPDAAKVVTHDDKRGIRMYQWAFTNDHILYNQDKGGDENWHVYSTDLKTGKTIDLTPFDGVAARIEDVNEKTPDFILVGLNNRDKKYHDIHRVNIRTADDKMVLENKDGYAGYSIDNDGNVRMATKSTPDGGQEIFILKPDGKAESFAKIGLDDALTSGAGGFDKSGKMLYMLDSRGRNTAALTAIDLSNGNKQTLIAEDSKADAGEVLAHPTEKTIQAVAFTYDRKNWKVLDKSIEADLAYLKTVADGELNIGSRSLDDKKWIVTYVVDDGPARFYLYDRPSKKANFLFTNRPALDGAPLAKMHPVIIKSRDGLDLVSYLTLPKSSDPKNSGKPDKPIPMVLNVHGGPWARDGWGLNPTHQWLADRGFAVLSVNYRGSTGFGKNFINSANHEWAGKMHNDLLDAVDWAVKSGIADPKKVAIMGGSYGGYATLVGLTFTPETFACGVDIVGPSNLQTLLNSIPPYWQPMIETFTKRVGDHRTDDGKSLLNQRSPLTYVDRIKKPLLIGQGANDPRVNQAESDQIVHAMQGKKIPVTYVLYPDEGHGFARPENRMSFYAVSEAFLVNNLGGKFEPIGDDFKGSSIKSPAGADQVPGLVQKLDENK